MMSHIVSSYSELQTKHKRRVSELISSLLYDQRKEKNLHNERRRAKEVNRAFNKRQSQVGQYNSISKIT